MNPTTHAPDGTPLCLYCGRPMLPWSPLPGGFTPDQPPLHTGCLAPFQAVLARLHYWNPVGFAAAVLRGPGPPAAGD